MHSRVSIAVKVHFLVLIGCRLGPSIELRKIPWVSGREPGCNLPNECISQLRTSRRFSPMDSLEPNKGNRRASLANRKEITWDESKAERIIMPQLLSNIDGEMDYAEIGEGLQELLGPPSDRL